MNLFVLFGLLLVVGFAYGRLSCLDENGKPVDSWVVLKQADSFNYYYLTGSSWTKSKNSLSQGTSGMVMLTATQAYTSGIQMGMYNDEMAGTSVSGTHAHAKGILAADATSGFWIVHSMPKWPRPTAGRVTGPGPFDSGTYGQSMECITISPSTAEVIASNLNIADVFFTGKNNALASKFPKFSQWISGNVDTSRTTVVTNIKTLGGDLRTQFVKSRQWGKDLWDALVAPYYKSALSVETWRNGVGGRIGSVCKSPTGPKKQPYDVLAVSTVTMPDGTSWAGTSDHSKWAVSIDGTSSGSKAHAWCVGGINRMCSQSGRGGGALCSQGMDGHTAFRAIATATEPCWEHNPCTGAGSGSCYWCPAKDYSGN